MRDLYGKKFFSMFDHLSEADMRRIDLEMGPKIVEIVMQKKGKFFSHSALLIGRGPGEMEAALNNVIGIA